jgi:K+-transporting ATPase KdpF subunit
MERGIAGAQRGCPMSASEVILSFIAVVLLGYLVYALVRPERF